MKKERLAAVLLALGLVGAAVPAEAAERNFSDTSGHYAGEVIGVWSGYEVLRGYPDGTFRPDGVITRGELAVVLDRVMGYRAAAEKVGELISVHVITRPHAEVDCILPHRDESGQ